MRTRERAASLPSETARLLRDDTVKPQVRLPDVQPGHRAPGDHPLDLRCALEDREDRGLADSFRRSAACGGRGISTDSAPDSRGWRRFWSARGRPQHDGQRRPKARYRPSDDPKFPATGATSTGTSKVHLLTDLPSGLRGGRGALLGRGGFAAVIGQDSYEARDEFGRLHQALSFQPFRDPADGTSRPAGGRPGRVRGARASRS
jgi:hypothetical protein